VSSSRSHASAASSKSTKGAGAKDLSGFGAAPSQSAAPVAAVQERRVRKILQTIEAEPPRNIDDLAQEFNLSPSHLQHVFKQQTGTCLGHVLTEQRLQRAAQLLVESNLSVKEIAHLSGYEHTSSFIRAFERRFLQAPRRYRQSR
jgi:AraC-like DNA-binding protein